MIWMAFKKHVVDLTTGVGETLPLSESETIQKNADIEIWTAGINDRAFKELRQKRNLLLHDTDWWASNDLIMTQEQKDYRQALRDLPANTPDPANPTWPVAPA